MDGKRKSVDTGRDAQKYKEPDGGAGAAAEDRLVAALLLRDARERGARAAEEGLSAFLQDPSARQTVNAKLLQGEISQVTSHNRRCGVEPMPRQAPTAVNRAKAEVASLETEFARSAHQLREGGPAAAAPAAPAGGTAVFARKRQRVGGGQALDVAAARASEAQRAEEEADLADPLLRPPPARPEPSARKPAKPDAVKEPQMFLPGRVLRPVPEPSEDESRVLWPSKGLRVRIVDGDGRFSAHHLKKGVVRRRTSAKLTVDIELEGGDMVEGIPQALLETVVSKKCCRVEVVRGPHRGQTARLLRRDPNRNLAVVGLGADEVQLQLDDVCEFQ